MQRRFFHLRIFFWVLNGIVGLLFLIEVWLLGAIITRSVRDEALAPIAVAIGIVLVATFAVVLMAYWIRHNILHISNTVSEFSRSSLADLTRGLSALARGDWTVKVEPPVQPVLDQRNDEMGQVAVAMDEIVQEVRVAVDAYEQSRLELQGLYAQIEERNQILSMANIHLHSQATIDPLTGIYNHRMLMGMITGEVARCQEEGTSFALLFVDVDHFKKVNDTYGHSAGDAVLYEVASRLSAATGMDAIGRYGGEEFAIVLKHVDSMGAYERAEALRRLIWERPFYWETEDTFEVIPLQISISVGVALFHKDGRSREELLEAADRAMYRAKHSGRNRVCLASEVLSGISRK